MKPIVVLTDFSEQASQAFQLAYQMAVKSKKPITLLHIIEPELEEGYSFMSEHVSGEAAGHTEELIENARKNFEILLSDPRYAEADISYQVSRGYSNEITEILEKGPELIIMGQRHAITMGTRGASAGRELHIGMYMDKFIRQSECPVLMVKEMLPDFSFKNLVLACSFRENFPEILFDKVKEMTRLFGSTIHFVWVKNSYDFQEDDSGEMSLAVLARGYGIENYTTQIYEAETIEEGVIKCSEAIEADLLALALPCQVGLPGLLSGSMVEEIMNRLGKPVLTICQ